jgi:hypothetical protein
MCFEQYTVISSPPTEQNSISVKEMSGRNARWGLAKAFQANKIIFFIFLLSL